MGQVRDRHWTDGHTKCKRELGILSLECAGANGPTFIHTGTVSGDPDWAKGRDGAAYVMPKWTGRMPGFRQFRADCTHKMINVLTLL